MEGKLMIVGTGDLGGHALEFLSRVTNMAPIICGDIDEDKGRRKANSAILGASYFGHYPEIRFHKIDLFNIDQTAETIAREKPTVIYNAATLQSWWVVTLLPKEVHREVYTGLGIWLPAHLALVHKLMKAVKLSGIDVHVVNSAFPDATNVVLGKVGLAPTIGIGNIDLLTAPLRKVISEKMKIASSDVQVYLVGQHYVNYNVFHTGSINNAPNCFIKIIAKGQDVSALFDHEKLYQEVVKRASRPAGTGGQLMVASSACKNILAIMNNTNELTSAPGPDGLPGGYPVRLNRNGAEVVLFPEISLEEAIKINEAQQRLDGIEEIRDDGTAVFTDQAYLKTKELIGYDCKEMPLDDAEMRAKELTQKYKEFARKHGVID